MSEWISVKDRLPDTSKRVLICLLEICVTEGHYNHGKKLWRMHNEMRGEVLSVSHWMPLPDPPKEAQ